MTDKSSQLFKDLANENPEEAVVITVSGGTNLEVRVVKGMVQERVFYLLSLAAHECLMSASDEPGAERPN